MKQDGITNPITLADKYRAIYMSMWRMNERHWRYAVATPCNINSARGSLTRGGRGGDTSTPVPALLQR